MRELICIVCPRGCHLKVTSENDNYKVTGNSCPRGEKYAISEITNPTRMVTSTVRVLDGDLTRLPVVTSKPIPKRMIFEVMKEINKTYVYAPIKTHQVIIKNILGLDADIYATRDVMKK